MTAPIRGLIDLLSPGSRSLRRGAAQAEILGGVAGGGLGAAYGGLTGDDEESRLARAAGFGLAGAGLGYGAVRGLESALKPRVGAVTGEAPTTLSRPEALRQATRNVTRTLRTTTPPLETPGVSPLTVFPENRRPLLERMDLTPSERVMVEPRIRRVEPTIKRPVTEKQYRARVAKVLGTKDIPELAAIDPRRATPEEAGALLDTVRDLQRRMSAKSAALAKAAPDEAASLTDDIDALEETGTRLLRTLMQADTEAGRNLAPGASWPRTLPTRRTGTSRRPASRGPRR